jgi:hypothetical protein
MFKKSGSRLQLKKSKDGDVAGTDWAVERRKEKKKKKQKEKKARPQEVPGMEIFCEFHYGVPLKGLRWDMDPLSAVTPTC